LVPSIALPAAYLLMGAWAVRAFCWAYGLSTAFFVSYLIAVIIFGLGDSAGSILREGRVHWSLTSLWSVVAACLVIGVYLAINAASPRRVIRVGALDQSLLQALIAGIDLPDKDKA
jgi:hypothetical protein